MKVLYISTSFDEEDIKNVFNGNGEIPYAANKYNYLLASGISLNGVSVTKLSFWPVSRANCSKIIIPPKTKQSGKLKEKYFMSLNASKLKNILRIAQTFLYVLFSPSDTAIIYDLMTVSPALGAVKAAKLRRFKRVCLVTDLPEDVGCRGYNDKIMRRLIEDASGYILLTPQMSEKINPARKGEIVIEGLVDSDVAERSGIPDNTEKSVLYAGALEKRFGVDTLVEAFRACGKENERLHLFGSGSYAEEIRKISENEPGIVYHGNCPNSEVVEAEQHSTLLVNPRTSEGSYTKYSFPSKVMEYFSSGTPVLMARLPGIGEEYYGHCLVFDDSSRDGLQTSLRAALDMECDELTEIGKNARDFVLQNKSKIAQGKRAVEFISSL